jgi:hypothetical protein
MAAQTGRTTSKWTDFQIKDSGGTLRSIPVSSINGVGLDYDQVDLTAFIDAVKGALPNQPNVSITISGPFDTTAVAAAGTISGSHTVLYNLAGGVTPLSLNIQFGMRHAWVSGEPTFGITASSVNGVLVKSYTFDPDKATYTAVIYPAAGSSLPNWGTTAFT